MKTFTFYIFWSKEEHAEMIEPQGHFWWDLRTSEYLPLAILKWLWCHFFLLQLVVNSSSPLLCPQALNLVSSHICRPLSQFYVCEIPQSWVSVPCNLLNCCHIFLLPAICILLTVLTVSAWQETKLSLRATIWPQLKKNWVVFLIYSWNCWTKPIPETRFDCSC